MTDEHNLISKSRPLLSVQKTDYNLNEFKLLDLYLSRINPLDPNTARVTIKLSEYCRVMGIGSGKIRSEQLRTYTAHFLGNVVTLPRPDGKKGYIQKVLFTTAEYDEEKGEIVLACNSSPEIFNTFFNVQNVGYVRYILKNTLHLKSIYSYKLYTFIKFKEPAKEFKIEVRELRQKLDATIKRYESFKHFSQEVLKKAVADINANTDTYIEYERLTRARITYALRFKIKRNPTFSEPVRKTQKGSKHSKHLEAPVVLNDPLANEPVYYQNFCRMISKDAFNDEFDMKDVIYLIKLGSNSAKARIPATALTIEEVNMAKADYFRECYLDMNRRSTSKTTNGRLNYLIEIIKGDL